MRNTDPTSTSLLDGLARPQRLGVFGRRGVGKTTLLAVLYQEAAAGRLPGLRLAAADARTADYLGGKIALLESGQVLPPTLSETELRLNLYQGERRVELVLLDYQGEHVAVGRRESVREFVGGCDVVWLLLDGAIAQADNTPLDAQQEVEQIVEDYLAIKDPATPHRPMALIVTKADLLGQVERYLGPAADADALVELAERRFGLARHVLNMHCSWSGLFAVSARGAAARLGNPAGLAEPLQWLMNALAAQDEARLQQLRQLDGEEVRLLTRGLGCFARRFPRHEAIAGHQRHIQSVRRRRLRRRGIVAAIAATALFLCLIGYDALGARTARRFAANHTDEPAEVRDHWHRYQAWHLTRNWLRPAAANNEREFLRDLDNRIRDVQAQERLQGVRRQAADPDANPEIVWQAFRAFQVDCPQVEIDGDLQQFRDELRARQQAERERRARLALADLERAETSTDLADLLARADAFLREFAGTTLEAGMNRRRATYLRRLDERDFETARAYSAQQPLNFHTRCEKYRAYLDKHAAGAFVEEATVAVAAISAEWDRHDFRQARDQFQARPLDLKEVAARGRAYLAAHPDGRFRAAAAELVRWCERSGTEGEYRVVLGRGSFDKKAAAYFSRGPRLSVEIEVNGIRHGPSAIADRGLEPVWNFEFPRRVRWKVGDPVVIRVTDNWYWRRQVLQISSAEDDPLALRLLSGPAEANDHTLYFESDFRLPTLPDLE